ncbi:MAG: aminotransferase class V-fold PLP-dependent enzyme [Planctomycetes bacterium]|nr:aminotransferase class V-fold PLP-dependent enzyme [Planctomycetota bacterium]
MSGAETFDLDHNATTPVLPEVLDRFVAVERECPGNPASLHAAGRRARAVIEAARQQVANALLVPTDDVFFVGSATEADNLAVRGAGDPDRPVLLAETEHAAVREAAMARGVRWWRVDAQGRAEILAPPEPVGMLTLVHAQSEVGTVQPVAAAAELAAVLHVPLHVDAAQSLGRLPLHEIVRLADSVALSPHKAGGLRGVGILIARRAGQRLRPLWFGGGQERGLRPGTQSAAAIAAAALAIELAVAGTVQRAVSMAAARDAFLTTLQVHVPSLRALTPRAESLPNTLLLAFPDVDGRNLLPALDLQRVAASSGSACSSGSSQPARILFAMGLDDAIARTCIRFSFSHTHSPEFAARAARVVGEVVSRLRKNFARP